MKENEKLYEELEMEIIRFYTEDIITDSVIAGGDNGGGDGSDDI